MKTTFNYLKFKLPSVVLSVIFALLVQVMQAQTSITTIGTPVTQNFNSLGSSGSVAWANNSTLEGWYATIVGSNLTTYAANNGSATSVGLYSLGSAGSSDRAIGVVPGGSTGQTVSYYGWRLKNTTGGTIKVLRVSWYGEQWSQNAQTASAQDIKLYYRASTSALTSLTSGTFSTADSRFLTPKFNTGPTGAIDGNDASNRELVVAYITVNLANNSEIMLRWQDVTDANNQIIALDDVSVVATSDQEVEFDALATKKFGDSSFALTAAATSGLPITFSCNNSSVAVITGNTVSIVGAGYATITATQAGNDYYSPASATQDLYVKPNAPEIIPASSITSSGFTANWLESKNGLTESQNINYVVLYTLDSNFDTYYTTSESSNDFSTLSGLIPNSIYYYRVWAIVDGIYSDVSESTFVVTGNNYNSTANNTWDQMTWDRINDNLSITSSQTPGTLANKVTVFHDVVLPSGGADAYVNTLEIDAGASLTIRRQIYVSSELIINVDKNDDAGQVLNNSNIVFGSGARIIIRRKFDNSRWHFVGFPFDVPLDNIYLAGTTTQATWGDASTISNPYKDFYVRQYNGSARDQLGTIFFNNIENGGYWQDVNPHGFTANKGYILAVAKTGDVTLDFVAPANSNMGVFGTSKTYNVNRYITNDFAGHHSWNLITTPFVSSYDLQFARATPYYIYNYSKLGIEHNYDIYMPGDGVNVVKPYLSYFMQSGSGIMSFSDGGNRALAPSIKNFNDFDEIGLMVENIANGYSDKTRIRLQESASVDYVIDTEATKMFSQSNIVPQIFTKLANGYPMAVNMLPNTENNIPVNFKAGLTGQYKISLYNSEKVVSYSQVILVDNLLSKQVNLLIDDYTFNVNTIGTSERFKIILTPTTTTGYSVINSDISVIASTNSIRFNGLSSVANVDIFDVTGKLLLSLKNVYNNREYDIQLRGVYVIRINDNGQLFNAKCLIK
jgi:hypothetical protein